MCTDCWFWREMSCALANPVNGACANRRPVRGRAIRPVVPAQAQLVPLAAGHEWQADQPAAVATVVAAPAVAPAAPVAVAALAVPAAPTHEAAVASTVVHVGPAPFSSDAPEQTFTASALRGALPSAREIRAARAAAATRPPVAEVVVPMEAAGGMQLSLTSERTRAVGSDCIDQLVERVRRRTAARLSRRD